MKLTKTKLKRIIKEELENVLSEQSPAQTDIDDLEASGVTSTYTDKGDAPYRDWADKEEKFHKYEETPYHTLGKEAIRLNKPYRDSVPLMKLVNAARRDPDAQAILDAVYKARPNLQFTKEDHRYNPKKRPKYGEVNYQERYGWERNAKQNKD
jgi:polyphosphate kinase